MIFKIFSNQNRHQWASVPGFTTVLGVVMRRNIIAFQVPKI